ncbi:hypothetical protein PI126_g8535 [Phytophthora idaei]|nr:hypothetical protein PI126_g8535 [Phytophthora idaei]
MKLHFSICAAPPSAQYCSRPVALHELVEYLVIDTEEPEFILGQDVLKILGIDIDRQLEQLAKRNGDDEDGTDDLKDDLPVLEASSTDDELRAALDSWSAWLCQMGFLVGLRGTYG